jgi:phytol kinase
MMDPVNITADLGLVGAITVMFGALFVIAQWWWNTFQPPVEYTRKFLHTGCGLIAAPLAWLISSPWTMLLLGAGFIGVVALSRKLGWLPCLHAVERCSHGATLYPASIFLTYLIAWVTGHPEFYCAAVLVLAVSDSAASLIGLRFGRHRVLVEDDLKSLEGSCAFFGSAFLIVFATLVLSTELAVPVCLLCAAYVATLATCVELLSLSGADNLFIPLAVIAILLKITTKEADEIVWQLGLLVLDFGIIAALLSQQRVLKASGVIGLGLLTYGAHSLVDLSWAYVVVLSVACWSVACRLGFGFSGTYRIRFIFLATFNLSVWILITNYLDLPPHVTFPAFAACATGTLQLILKETRSGSRINSPSMALVLAIGIGSWHCLLDPMAVWWFDVSVLFVGTLVYVAATELWHQSYGPFLDRIRAATPAGIAVSILFFAVSWSFHVVRI